MRDDYLARQWPELVIEFRAPTPLHHHLVGDDASPDFGIGPDVGIVGREGDAHRDHRHVVGARAGEESFGSLDDRDPLGAVLGDAETNTAFGVQDLVLIMQRKHDIGHGRAAGSAPRSVARARIMLTWHRGRFASLAPASNWSSPV